MIRRATTRRCLTIVEKSTNAKQEESQRVVKKHNALLTTFELPTRVPCTQKKSVHVSIATFNNPDNKNTQNHSALNVMNEGKTNRKKESYTYTHTLLYRFDI